MGWIQPDMAVYRPVVLRSLADFEARFGQLRVGRFDASYSVELAEPRGFALWGARRGWAQLGGEYDRRVTARRGDRAAAAAKGWLSPRLGGHHSHVHVGVKGRKRLREARRLAGLREMGNEFDTIWRGASWNEAEAEAGA